MILLIRHLSFFAIAFAALPILAHAQAMRYYNVDVIPTKNRNYEVKFYNANNAEIQPNKIEYDQRRPAKIQIIFGTIYEEFFLNPHNLDKRNNRFGLNLGASNPIPVKLCHTENVADIQKLNGIARSLSARMILEHGEGCASDANSQKALEAYAVKGRREFLNRNNPLGLQLTS